MTTLNRLRRVQHTALKAQRRLWLAQMALWPTLVLTGVGIAAASALWFRRRQTRPPEPASMTAQHSEPGAPATNGQLSHT